MNVFSPLYDSSFLLTYIKNRGLNEKHGLFTNFFSRSLDEYVDIKTYETFLNCQDVDHLNKLISFSLSLLSKHFLNCNIKGTLDEIRNDRDMQICFLICIQYFFFL